jgi:hypothetical protein
MAPRPKPYVASALAAALAAAPLSQAAAWTAPAGGFGTLAAGPVCAQPISGGSTININKSIHIFKPVTINNKINVY